MGSQGRSGRWRPSRAGGVFAAAVCKVGAHTKTAWTTVSGRTGSAAGVTQHNTHNRIVLQGVREAREQELALLGIHPVRYRSRGSNVFFLLRRAAGREAAPLDAGAGVRRLSMDNVREEQAR